ATALAGLPILKPVGDHTGAPLQLGSDVLTPRDVVALARGTKPPEAVIDRAALSRVDSSVVLRDRLIAENIPIYGVTTGFGDSNTGHISATKAAALQQNLIQYHLVVSGPQAAPELVRATMLIRADCRARCYSGR